MTRNLHARDDFQKGDLGYNWGHLVSKTPAAALITTRNVTALQDVKAGMNGWFEEGEMQDRDQPGTRTLDRRGSAAGDSKHDAEA